MISKSSRWLLALLANFIVLAPLAIAQKKGSDPVKYPIVHVRKWEVSYSLTASQRSTSGALIHQPTWNISGTGIIESSVAETPADETGRMWEGATESTGSLVGECWAEPTAGWRQTYVGGGSVSGEARSGNRMTLNLDAEKGTYEFSVNIEFDLRMMLDTSEAEKMIDEIKSKAKSNDQISEALLEMMRAMIKSAPAKERQTENFSPHAFDQPLPAGGAVTRLSGSQKVMEDIFGLICGGNEAVFTWNITPYDESKHAKVTLDGCSDLAAGQKGTVTAKGEPAGGTYRFWAEPSSTLGVASQGATAKISGAEPGQATLNVEYTAPDGKKGKASQQATTLRVDSINEGQPIPKIGLFDEDGKKTEATRTVPVSVQPGGAGDLLIYKTANPGMLTVVGQGDEVLLQGLRKGKTTFQATTKCGGPTGPIAEVEVVPCDDEVLAKLAEEEKIIDETLKQFYENDAKIREGEQFEEAEKIGEATGELLLKTGTLIIGSLAGGAGTSHATHTAAQIVEYGTIIHDGMKGGDASATAGVMATVNAAKMAVAAIVGSAIETHHAATEFGKSLGSMLGVADQLEANDKLIDQWREKKHDVVRRKKLCREGGEPAPPVPPEPPKKPQPPKKDQPPKKGEPPTTEPPTPTEPPSEEPGEPPSPPPPTSEPRHFALPYNEADCGCQSTGGKGQAIGIGKAGSSGKSTRGGQAGKSSGKGPVLGAKASTPGEIRQGLTNLGSCVEQFKDGPLAEYQKTLDEWNAILSELQSTASAPQPSGRQESIKRLESLIGRTKDFDKAGHEFYSKFEPCPGEVKGAAGVLTAKPSGK